MEFFADWKFWFALLAVIQGSVQWYTYSKITGNNVDHIEKNMEKLALKTDQNAELLGKISRDLAYVKGKTETESRVLEILQKSLDKN